MNNDYYVYTLAYPDGNVFYVGKGKGKRIDQHEAEARKGIQLPRCEIIREIEAQGNCIIKNKVYEGLSHQQALELEIKTMHLYGLESLANQTIPGAKQAKWATEEWRASQRAKSQEAWRLRRISGLWHSKS